MLYLFKEPSQIVTVNTYGKGFKSGTEMNNIDVLENYSIVVENGIIKDFIKNTSNKLIFDLVIDYRNKIILPGLVECHTHIPFGGNRANEFNLRIKGKSYEEITFAGGGIHSTVKATRSLNLNELISLIDNRVKNFISQGITTLEMKSGYGLSYESELNLLNAINLYKKSADIDIISTFLGAHLIPKEFSSKREEYMKLLIEHLLPEIKKNNLAEFVDAFCEKTAFTPDEVNNLFYAAKELGFALKLHTDQFNSIGGLDIALNNDAVSVDHLEVISLNEIAKFEKCNTIAVLLPGVSFFLDYDFAPARYLIDSNVPVALSTDFNPGSSHIANLHFIMSLASIKMKMTMEEVISAVTINAAKALKRSDITGSIEIGKFADFSIYNTDNFENIIYSVGVNLIYETIKKGEIIYKS